MKAMLHQISAISIYHDRSLSMFTTYTAYLLQPFFNWCIFQQLWSVAGLLAIMHWVWSVIWNLANNTELTSCITNGAKSRLAHYFVLFLDLGLLFGYLAKSDVIFLLGNPNFL